ncbi:thiol-disulfide oxidoreductase [Siansivirga zeaxanthinifaciens CC-SAMT-1]|uniref:Thiol-disulfide oxidoreductase n=1 Tax=Siansivirga zeaxanthinifaciens CC-SAMT-1 TaxID=1454006 RepID=A0A0C5WAQ2_9FLAO|nr:thiol-disulfide oxidoreductase [Siansivirga zeaxanthinifaciens CC-SAMT-1]
MTKNHQVVLFDGVCNLCNSSVQFIIKNDKKGVFKFAPLQGTFGKDIINKYQIDTTQTDSIILLTKNGLKIKSTAALYISKALNFPLNLLFVFIIVPAFIRDGVYNVIAKNRYKWFGKKEACMIPTPELKNKFLE